MGGGEKLGRRLCALVSGATGGGGGGGDDDDDDDDDDDGDGDGEAGRQVAQDSD